jgi:hypothetical protein
MQATKGNVANEVNDLKTTLFRKRVVPGNGILTVR